MKTLKFLLYTFLLLVLQGDYAFGMKKSTAYLYKYQGPKGPALGEVTQAQSLQTEQKKPSFEMLKQYKATVQQQLLHAIFIVLQMPLNVETKAFKLCAAGKNVFLDEHLSREIKLAERETCGRTLEDLNDDAVLSKMHSTFFDDFDTKYPGDFMRLEEQNFNPGLFRLIEEYAYLVSKIGCSPKKIGHNFLNLAGSAYILYATFLTYLDDASKEHIKQTIIGQHALERLSELSSTYKYGCFAAIAPEDIDLLLNVNAAILNFFLGDLGFQKPRMNFVFKTLPQDQKALYVRAKKFWIAVQKSAIGEEFIPDFKCLQREIQTTSFLQYRRQEIFDRACKDAGVRDRLYNDLENLFRPKSLTGKMAALKI